jgi:hypothetical protein
LDKILHAHDGLRDLPDDEITTWVSAACRAEGQDLVIDESLTICIPFATKPRPRRSGLGARTAHLHIANRKDPFVKPEEPTAVAAIEPIGEELALFDDWTEGYEFIVGMGRLLGIDCGMTA